MESSNDEVQIILKIRYYLCFQGGRGILIVQQIKPMRKSTYDITLTQNDVTITTTNTRRIRLYEPKNGPINWLEKEWIMIDGDKINLKDSKGSKPIYSLLYMFQSIKDPLYYTIFFEKVITLALYQKL